MLFHSSLWILSIVCIFLHPSYTIFSFFISYQSTLFFECHSRHNYQKATQDFHLQSGGSFPNVMAPVVELHTFFASRQQVSHDCPCERKDIRLLDRPYSRLRCIARLYFLFIICFNTTFIISNYSCVCGSFRMAWRKNLPLLRAPIHVPSIGMPPKVF